MLNMIIADSEVELVPEEIAGHPAIRRRARNRRKDPRELLLDSNLDYPAMRNLVGGDRRGRPDIAHFCLIIALDSIPSREGGLNIHVHTRNDVVLSFKPVTRLPRAQARFYGILEKILSTGSGTDLIGYRRMGLEELCSEISPERTLVLSGSGDMVDLREQMMVEDILVIVGGFPKGQFISPVDKIADATISCHPDSLDAWTAVSEVICSYRNSR